MLARLLHLVLGISFITACAERPDPVQQAEAFCSTLVSVNRGKVDTEGLPELAGHAKVLNRLLKVTPAAIEDELEQFHSAFENWAAAVSGDQPMLDTFDELTDSSLAGAEGRIGDYIAEHCGLRLGDGSYNDSPRPIAQDICPGWPRIGNPNTFNNFPNLPDISDANYFANDYMISRIGLATPNPTPATWVKKKKAEPTAT